MEEKEVKTGTLLLIRRKEMGSDWGGKKRTPVRVVKKTEK